MIKRADFIGFSVHGPGGRAKPSYQAEGPEAWPKWSATLEGPHLVFEGEGRRIEVPRARCIVYMDPTTKPDAPLTPLDVQLNHNKAKR